MEKVAQIPGGDSGSEKRVFWKRGLFRKVHFLEILEVLDSRDSRESPDCGTQRRVRPFSRDSREFRDFRDSRDSSSEKTPFVMTPFSGPERQQCRTRKAQMCINFLSAKFSYPPPIAKRAQNFGKIHFEPEVCIWNGN